MPAFGDIIDHCKLGINGYHYHEEAYDYNTFYFFAIGYTS
jgi:hypothetical protein